MLKVALITVLLLPSVSFAKDSTSFESRLKRLEQRFDDFYKRKKVIDERRKKRETFANEHKVYRERLGENYEKSRQQFVESRKAKPSLEKWLPEYEKLVEGRKKQQVKEAKGFVVQRDRIKSIIGSGKKVPERQDVGLDEL